MVRCAALVTALFLAGCGGGDRPAATGTAPPPATATSPVGTPPASAPAPTADEHIRVVVAGGKVVERPGARVRVRRGERVLIEVTTDVSDEVHVHSYDLKARVAPGSPARLEFVASIPGVIDVELEEQHLLLFKLEVR